MTGTAEHRDIVAGIDPARDGHLAPAWAVDDAHRRDPVLRLVAAVPPPRHTRHVDDTPRHQAQRQAGKQALHATVRSAHDRRRLSQTNAGRAEKHSDVRLTHEVHIGPPVETPADVAEQRPGRRR
ncbi:universal stress protein [Streptomyces sp. NPDC056222]|uniref:universal stress protein n=1 Tax=Streptomyces sp. NPDC056222 TaxID=3345749 RepID=UPI0035D99B00